MDIKEVVTGRRNIKQFTANPIDRREILEWFQAASYAPNHRMKEPWEILFIGPKTRLELNHKANFGDAPVVFAVLSEGSENALESEENAIAASCFVQNFSLIAWEHGVGIRWTSIGATEQSRNILHVPEGYRVIGIFGLGHPQEVPKVKSRTPIEDKVRDLP